MSSAPQDPKMKTETLIDELWHFFKSFFSSYTHKVFRSPPSVAPRVDTELAVWTARLLYSGGNGMSTDSRTDVCDKLWATLPPILFWDTVLDQDKRNTCSSRSRTGPRSSTRLPPALDRSLHYTESQLMGREPDGVEADRYISSCPPPESSGRSQACRLPLGSKMPTRDCLQTVSASSSGIYYFPRPEIDSGTQGRPLPKCYSRSGVPGHTMDGNARNRAGEDTDLRCVEVSALGTSAAFPQSCRGNLEEPGSPRCENIQEQTTEDFLAALLLKTDTYRPRQESLLRMRNECECGFCCFFFVWLRWDQLWPWLALWCCSFACREGHPFSLVVHLLDVSPNSSRIQSSNTYFLLVPVAASFGKTYKVVWAFGIASGLQSIEGTLMVEDVSDSLELCDLR